ncbi:MAG: glycosyltransferase [Bacteroidetes bacterium]|nr:glycosyltransferase [Bacteroidota bacterium]
MPKVLRIINRLNLGGPTYNVGYLSKYLAPEFETLLVSGMRDESEGSSEHIIDTLGIKAQYINCMRREISLVDDVKSYYEIKKIINQFKPDIVHTHMAKPGAVGRLAAINCKVPVVLHTFHGHYFHSYFSPLKTKIFQHIEQYLARKTSGIIAISSEQQKELSQDFKIAPPEKTLLSLWVSIFHVFLSIPLVSG